MRPLHPHRLFLARITCKFSLDIHSLGYSAADMARKTLFVVVGVIIVTVAAAIILGRFDWFKRNEHVALWLEGIALILIFVWDRLDAQAEHKETLAQIEIAKQTVPVCNQLRTSMAYSRSWLA